MKKLIILLLVGTLALTGCQTSQDKSTKNERVTQEVKNENANTDSDERNPLSGTDLSTLKVEDYDGVEYNVDTFKNNELTVINLWGTWCGLCVEEMPDFEKVAKEYEDKGIQILGLALDSSDDEVEELKQQLSITYPLLKENDQTKELLSNHFDYVPVTIFVNAEGKAVSDFIAGSATAEELKAKIEGLINE